MTTTKQIHNHGSEDGAGLACREITTPAGGRRGECMPRQRWTFEHRWTTRAGNDYYIWHRRNEAGELVDCWATPVAELLGRSS